MLHQCLLRKYLFYHSIYEWGDLTYVFVLKYFTFFIIIKRLSDSAHNLRQETYFRIYFNLLWNVWGIVQQPLTSITLCSPSKLANNDHEQHFSKTQQCTHLHFYKSLSDLASKAKKLKRITLKWHQFTKTFVLFFPKNLFPW